MEYYCFKAIGYPRLFVKCVFICHGWVGREWTIEFPWLDKRRMISNDSWRANGEIPSPNDGHTTQALSNAGGLSGDGPTPVRKPQNTILFEKFEMKNGSLHI
jgi:hypothetical protein